MVWGWCWQKCKMFNISKFAYLTVINYLLFFSFDAQFSQNSPGYVPSWLLHKLCWQFSRRWLEGQKTQENIVSVSSAQLIFFCASDYSWDQNHCRLDKNALNESIYCSSIKLEQTEILNGIQSHILHMAHDRLTYTVDVVKRSQPHRVTFIFSIFLWYVVVASMKTGADRNM